MKYVPQLPRREWNGKIEHKIQMQKIELFNKITLLIEQQNLEIKKMAADIASIKAKLYENKDQAN